MADEIRSLVLHYDEEKDEIVFFSVPASSALALRRGEGFEIAMSEFRALTPDEAERRVGEGVFHMFDRFATRKTGIRDYAAEFEKDLEKMIADLELVAGSGDPKVQYDLSILYHDLAVRQQSWEHFNKAESLTRAAAQAGLPAAIDAMSDWEVLRHAFARRIQRT